MKTTSIIWIILGLINMAVASHAQPKTNKAQTLVEELANKIYKDSNSLTHQASQEPLKNDQPEVFTIPPNLKNPFIPQTPIRQIIIPPPTTIPIPEEKKVNIDIPVLPKFDIVPPTLDIQGVIWNTTRPQAIINNQVINIGDIINDVTITNITAQGIEGLYQGVKISQEKDGKASVVKE